MERLKSEDFQQDGVNHWDKKMILKEEHIRKSCENLFSCITIKKSIKAIVLQILWKMRDPEY